MDYFGFINRAAKITWRYKMLWVLGLFAGTVSSNSNVRETFQQQNNTGSTGADPFTQWVSQHPANFAIIVGVLFFIGLLFWVVSLTAQGGLVYGANEAAEERTPRLGACWRVGLDKLGRTFMLGLVLGLPLFVFWMLFVVILLAMGFGGYLLGDTGGAAGGAIVGVCLVLPVFIVIGIVLSLAFTIIYQLALRYGVLQDITFGEAIKRGWYDLRGKRGAVVFWLVMLLPAILATIVFTAIAVPIFVPAGLAIVAGKWVIGIGLVVFGWLVMLLPSAIYATFVSVAWTLFFRTITGMETAAPSGYAPPVREYRPPAPQPWENQAPPAPPMQYPPAAPPIEPAPPAPPAAPPAPPAEPAPSAPPAPPQAPEGGWPTGQ